MKKIISLSLIILLVLSVFTACSKNDKNNNNVTGGSSSGNSSGSQNISGNTGNSGDASKGKVYYLNFKPEIAELWENIGREYTDDTGIEFVVKTAASGTYESTLKSEIAKTNAPTIFQINGPVGYNSWKEYCSDLKETKLYDWLIDKDMAITSGDGVYGIPFAVEGYGIIYNQDIMEDYFETDGAVVTDMDKIKNFETLKKVVEDMTGKKEQLGIEGVFASTSFATGEDWRWQTHLANIPVYYEYQSENVSDMDNLSFKYSDNFKNILDLYINNSITLPALLSTKTVNDSMAEFALGQVAMVQNGNWAWSQISEISGNLVDKEDIKFLPIYTGMENEETQGLCIGTENFICINKNASADDQAASISFLEWLFNSPTGKKYVVEELGFITPFSTFNDDEKPDDPLAREIIRYMENENTVSVPWNFTTFPNQTFKDNFGASLLSYCQGQKEWSQVVADMIKGWSAEKSSMK